MDRSGLTALAVALLCVASLGVAATTLESTLTTDPDEEIDIDWDRLPIGQDEAVAIQEQMGDGADDGDDTSDAAESDDPAADDSEEDGAPSGGEEGEDEADTHETDGSDGDGGTEDVEADGSQDAEADGGEDEGIGLGMGTAAGPPSLLAILLALLAALLRLLLVLAVLLAVAALVYRYREEIMALLSDEETATPDPEPPAEDRRWPPAGPSNAVERAWLELVRLADPERPATMTATECAAAARESGLDPTAVDEITTAFERTRYGGVPPEREEPRATGALERLREGHQVREPQTGRPEADGHGGERRS